MHIFITILIAYLAIGLLCATIVALSPSFRTRWNMVDTKHNVTRSKSMAYFALAFIYGTVSSPVLVACDLWRNLPIFLRDGITVVWILAVLLYIIDAFGGKI